MSDELKLYRGRIVDSEIKIVEETLAEKKKSSYVIDRMSYNKVIRFSSLETLQVQDIYLFYFEAENDDKALEKYKKIAKPFVMEKVKKLTEELDLHKNNLAAL